jgi:hypothetical protein
MEAGSGIGGVSCDIAEVRVAPVTTGITVVSPLATARVSVAGSGVGSVIGGRVVVSSPVAWEEGSKEAGRAVGSIRCVRAALDAERGAAAESGSSSLPRTFLIFLEDSLRTFWYSCEEKVEMIEATATPIIDPARPIFAEKKKTVTAARPLAKICTHEMLRKNFFIYALYPNPILVR